MALEDLIRKLIRYDIICQQGHLPLGSLYRSGNALSPCRVYFILTGEGYCCAKERQGHSYEGTDQTPY